jgi:hypothetical protein
LHPQVPSLEAYAGDVGWDMAVADRKAVIGAWLLLLISGGLLVRILMIGKPAVVVILIPAAIGAVLALRSPRQPAVLAVASLLTALTVVLSLIGGAGLLYVPSIALFVWAAISAKLHPQAT